VKPQRGGERHLKEQQQARASRLHTRPVTPAPVLTDEEAAVIDCLQEAATALTVKQLRSRVSCAPEVLEQALRTLVERELIARLNTIVPSYSCRRQGVPTDEG
jgi:hypothetical protein